MPDPGSSHALDRAALYLGLASAAAPLISIAASQLLLAMALAALLASRIRLRWPPIWLPLGLFVLGTLISLAASEDPSAGLPQVRKLFVIAMLPVVFSAVGELRQAGRLLLAWIGLAALSGALGLVQFARRWEEARLVGASFYEHYVSARISGFMSHWMTFGGQMMMAGLLLAAWLMFSGQARRGKLLAALAAAVLIAAALVLNMTRSIWLATAAGCLYLVWFWKRRLLLAVPVLAGALFFVGPESVRTRAISIYRPRQEVDSNQHRVVCWRTGWRMIQAHPWLGLGPEMVRLRFTDYLPADVAQPLPTGWYGHLHNLYLHYAAERGVATALALVWLLAQMFWDFTRAARRASGEAKYLLHGAAAVVLGAAVSGLFELNLGDSEVLMLFLAVAACGYLALEKVQEKPPHA